MQLPVRPTRYQLTKRRWPSAHQVWSHYAGRRAGAGVITGGRQIAKRDLRFCSNGAAVLPLTSSGSLVSGICLSMRMVAASSAITRLGGTRQGDRNRLPVWRRSRLGDAKD